MSDYDYEGDEHSHRSRGSARSTARSNAGHGHKKDKKKDHKEEDKGFGGIFMLIVCVIFILIVLGALWMVLGRGKKGSECKTASSHSGSGY